MTRNKGASINITTFDLKWSANWNRAHQEGKLDVTMREGGNIFKGKLRSKSSSITDALDNYLRAHSVESMMPAFRGRPPASQSLQFRGE